MTHPQDADHLYIALELCPGGDVAGLQASAGGRLSEAEAAAVVLQVGVCFLGGCGGREGAAVVL
jgi:hypothetical protein